MIEGEGESIRKKNSTNGKILIGKLCGRKAVLIGEKVNCVKGLLIKHEEKG